VVAARMCSFTFRLLSKLVNSLNEGQPLSTRSRVNRGKKSAVKLKIK
jgi:hypothetical protein